MTTTNSELSELYKLVHLDSKRAYATLISILNTQPETIFELENLFIHILNKVTDELEATKEYKELFICYEKAVDLFPGNCSILNSLGVHLNR